MWKLKEGSVSADRLILIFTDELQLEMRLSRLSAVNHSSSLAQIVAGLKFAAEASRPSADPLRAQCLESNFSSV